MPTVTTDAPTITALRVSIKRIPADAGKPAYDQLRVVLADLHLRCDVLDDRTIRLAKRLADDHGCAFDVDEPNTDRVQRALAGRHA